MGPAPHGKVPVGWQTGPAASDLIPDILDYFYKHATPNDVFVNALTGIGYIREAVYLEKLPKSEQEAAWKQYLELSRHYFKRMDLSTLTTFEAFQLMPQKTLARFTKLPGIKAIYRNYGRFSDTTVENATTEINGVPVFRAILDGLSRSPRRKRSAAVPQAWPGNSPVHPRPASRFPACVADELVRRHARAGGSRKELGPDYVAVRADHLPALYDEAKKR